MNRTKQVCALAVAGAVGFGALAAGPAVALPAPYNDGPTSTVSTTNPPVGGTVDWQGTNYGANEIVVLRIKSKAKTLKKVKTNRKGKFSTHLTLPKKYKCGHTLVARGKSSGKVTRIHIVIGKRSNCR